MSQIQQISKPLPDGAPYIERQTDRDLFEHLVRGESCHVQAPRQGGKSSLRIRTAARLRELGVKTVEVDLNQLGTQDTSEDQWYLALSCAFSAQQGLEDPTRDWAQLGATPCERLSGNLRRMISGKQVIIFLDEVDLLRELPFGKNALAILLGTHVPWLAICLLGIFDLDDILGEVQLPIVVRRLFLGDFSRDEFAGLSSAMSELDLDLTQLLDEIYSVTAGHPAMSWRLCERLAKERSQIPARDLVAMLLLEPGGTGEPSVGEIKGYIEAAGRTRSSELLRIYERILVGTETSFDQTNPDLRALVAWGLVSPHNIGSRVVLQPRNRIIAAVFSESWVRFEQLLAPGAPKRPLVDDYDHAVLHLAWDEAKGRRLLLFALVELLPREVLPPIDDGTQEYRPGFGSMHVVRVRHLVLSARRALDWYRNCAEGRAFLPAEISEHHEGHDLPLLQVARFREEPAWPHLVCDSVPYQACWHEVPRVHHLIPLEFVPSWSPDEKKAAQEWLAGRLHFSIAQQPNLWGSAHILAPSPVLRSFGDRLDPGHASSDAVYYYCVPRSGQPLRGLELIMREERSLGETRLYRLSINQPLSRLELDHIIDLHSAILVDEVRGPLWYSPPGVFIRGATVDFNGDSLQVSIQTQVTGT